MFPGVIHNIITDGNIAYMLIIGASLIVILSYLFSLFAKKTAVPSVILLIILGFSSKKLFSIGVTDVDLLFPLEILGIIGLMLIVLEGALDLKLSRERWPMIWKSGLIAILSLGINVFVFAFGIQYIIGNLDFLTAFIYAIPLSIISSAIVIPSVEDIEEEKKEFLIYESTLSDIFGLILFYAVINNVNTNEAAKIGFNVISNIGGTLILSVIVSYLLIVFFQKVRTQIKLFLFISVLLLLYSIGKVFHLSSLLIILVFGLILENRQIFFSGFMNRFLKESDIRRVLSDFKLLTRESAFIVRTFFFFVFGLSITIAGIFKTKVVVGAFIFMAIMFVVRWLLFKFILKRDFTPQVFIAPRGLISVLLYFAIPSEFLINDFESGILLIIILGTSIMMAWALVHYKLGKTGRLRKIAGVKNKVYRIQTRKSSEEDENSKPFKKNIV
ncbi:cation:proton antiporter domain-containing protein [Plebeiibacterium marinum]|uniref:Cation:proton antiporter n=1 Tax=Plebeiibacterium marinum TaxID=2992111 RepID=A0AAE3MHP2_9BACT|nr:cation:proton antiporter [Plebeiobacterium marinum]MCW3807257.1 cation:proton antiporter [Plebeiobacterium marinum]